LQIIIDRFEGDMAVCEKSDRSMINILRQKLPLQVKEGDVINVKGEFFEIDTIATQERKKTVEGLLTKLHGKNKPEDPQ
jgi:hypothetical protein